ncbi:MAG: hypothetical protein SRB1_00697 [Desulfobacteraceae bacterium Eth-SRB1]|nr:MAG: hypothetical protein SRB1_00697 [Desulfobacteraceae bacterium Eth-SRB1]
MPERKLSKIVISNGARNFITLKIEIRNLAFILLCCSSQFLLSNFKFQAVNGYKKPKLLPDMILFNGYYKKTLIAICLCIALFAGSGSVRGQGSGIGDQGSEVGGGGSEVGGQKSGVRSQGSEVRSQEICEEKFEYFNDFIIYYKPVFRDERDAGGKDRILVCDVVVELNRGMKLPQERIELRKIIYNTLKESSDLHEIRRSLKEKIKIGLNNFMNDEIIKKMYFTKFILL